MYQREASILICLYVILMQGLNGIPGKGIRVSHPTPEERCAALNEGGCARLILEMYNKYVLNREIARLPSLVVTIKIRIQGQPDVEVCYTCYAIGKSVCRTKCGKSGTLGTRDATVILHYNL